MTTKFQLSSSKKCITSRLDDGDSIFNTDNPKSYTHRDFNKNKKKENGIIISNIKKTHKKAPYSNDIVFEKYNKKLDDIQKNKIFLQSLLNKYNTLRKYYMKTENKKENSKIQQRTLTPLKSFVKDKKLAKKTISIEDPNSKKIKGKDSNSNFNKSVTNNNKFTIDTQRRPNRFFYRTDKKIFPYFIKRKPKENIGNISDISNKKLKKQKKIMNKTFESSDKSNKNSKDNITPRFNKKNKYNKIKNNKTKSTKAITSYKYKNKSMILPKDDTSLETTEIITKCTKIKWEEDSICQKGFAGPGVNKPNQDNFFIFNNLNNEPCNIFYGICDGHGVHGHDVSSYIANNLPIYLNNLLLTKNIKNLSEISLNIIKPYIISSFINVNEDLNKNEKIDCKLSGSTCVSLIFTPTKLFCINLGDSRCVLGKFNNEKWTSQNLSNDQTPQVLEEKERILKNNGRVQQFKDDEGDLLGPERIWLKEKDIPGLAMSRSFGDEYAHSVGVISEPEIIEHCFDESDKFVILASDGIWEFISNDECVNMVKDFYLKGNVKGAITHLYKESCKRWIMKEEIIDDISMIVVFFK